MLKFIPFWASALFCFLFVMCIDFSHSYWRAAQATSNKKTPVVLSPMGAIHTTEGERPWKPPNYADQEPALGYKPGAFSTLPGMEERVSFWIDIYSKYTTHQGLLHDSRYVHIVYESVDFTDIQARKDLGPRQKTKARRKRVKEAKRKIKQRLRGLNRLTSPAGLEGEDLRYWYMFSKVKEKNRFWEATKKNRLRFQLGQKDRFLQGIRYSGRYLQQMEMIFRGQGLPVELTRIPFVESSFNLKARSKVGASGIWQFMPYTGKQYLKVSRSVDERNDPILATQAAARMLRGNFKMLGSWPLAVTAYNHGPAGVRRLVRREKTSNLVELLDVRRGRFGFASANFFASFLAALEVEKNAQKYFDKPRWMAEHKRESFRLIKNIDHKSLISLFDGDIKKVRFFNPHIHPYVWRGWRVLRKGSRLFVPVGEKDKVLTTIRSWKGKKMARITGQKYRVKKGDTLSEIAQRFGVSVHSLVNANAITNPRGLRAGQRIIIPK